jgi:hypothetical protein
MTCVAPSRNPPAVLSAEEEAERAVVCVKNKSNPHAQTKEDRKGECGDASVLHAFKKFTPEFRVVGHSTLGGGRKDSEPAGTAPYKPNWSNGPNGGELCHVEALFER